MTAQVGISNLILEVNDEKVFYKQGTLEFSPGEPEAKLEGLASSGGTNIVATEDVSTAFGSVKFEMPATPLTVKQANKWKAAGLLGNTVRLSGATDFVLLNATLMSKIEVKIGVDGAIPIDFGGSSENSSG